MSNQTDVDQFLQTLDHPLQAEIEQVRAIILGSDEQITEHIKWNAPSFCYRGQDRVTMKLHPQNRIQLVFHRGAKVKDSQDFVFEDGTGLLKWAAKDRAVVTLHGMEDVKSKAMALEVVVVQWMKSTVE
jgi:uncharacterized protein YdeI (YjbR/CyaY-like superfamily)